MEYIRLQIKRYAPSLYGVIRNVLFPLHQKHTEQKRQSFTEKTVVQISRFGQSFKIVLDPQNGFVDTEIFTNGVYEPDILKLIQEHLHEGGTFIDIGANIGQHSLFAATHVGQTGQVIAFEPIPRIAAQLRSSLTLNKLSNVTINEVACSDTEGEARLTLVTGNIGGSSLHRKTDQNSILVKTQPADNFTAELARIDLIKIDAEGHELEVLRGLEITLAKHKPALIIEFSPSFWGDEAVVHGTEFFTILDKYGYQCFDLEEGHTLIAEPQEWVRSFTKQQTNLLCISTQPSK